MTNANYVAYYRVSTERQGQSGLGLEAQRKAVMDHLNGGTLLDSFTEVESGRRNDRPELAKALDLCRRRKATLVIAKLDRVRSRLPAPPPAFQQTNSPSLVSQEWRVSGSERKETERAGVEMLDAIIARTLIIGCREAVRAA